MPPGSPSQDIKPNVKLIKTEMKSPADAASTSKTITIGEHVICYRYALVWIGLLLDSTFINKFINKFMKIFCLYVVLETEIFLL